MNPAIEQYVLKAAAAGVEVERIAFADLPGRLETLLSERGATAEPAGRVVALPKSGWPTGLLDAVAATIERSGFDMESPVESADGLAWRRDSLARAILGVTFCNAFLAETGSLVLASGLGAGALASLMPEVHLALSYPTGCLQSLSDYLSRLSGALPSRLTLVTGPSRTGDIELSMTTGVHGPRRVLHWIVTDS